MRPPILLRAVAIACTATAIAAPEPYDPGRFEREVLVPACRDAVQLEVLPGGDIVFAEYWGPVKRRDAKTGKVTTLGTIATHAKGELGLLGLAVARDFEKSGHLFAVFCPAVEPWTLRVSRFTVKDGVLAPESERMLFKWSYDSEALFHFGGAAWMDAKGNLYVGSGDNSHHNPGLPVDLRPDRKIWDSLRSAGNTRDFRGKVLRVHPEPDGSYTIPEGNLFPGGKDGLPEIFAMGIRNPFRITFDDVTGTLYVGDVGPNISPKLGLAETGYEEINATKTAANFGWPLFTGPNESLPLFDFETNKEIKRFDPKRPENPSPRNTGAKVLPPAKPALVWFSSTPSKDFPTVGSGGRSVMAGPVYHFDDANPSTVKLPRELDGRLFIYEWMRSWVQTVKMGGKKAEVEPFLPSMNFRRPIDMKIGSDGALYLIEYGDQWWQNSDSRIVRIVYRRGNRAPVAAMFAEETAGVAPFTANFDATGNVDPDGEAVTFSWSVAGEEKSGAGTKMRHTFEKPGTYEVTLTVRDPGGATASVKKTVHVGNGRPVVRFDTPAHGSFFDWGAELPYKVVVTESDGEAVVPERAVVHGEFRPRAFLAEGEGGALDPGLALMRGSTCFACHMTDSPSAGPPYRQVALKYKDDPGAVARLAEKVITGGTGVWGQLPMPPHPQHTAEQAREMVAWVLSLKDDAAPAPKSGDVGILSAPKKPAGGSRVTEGVFVLTAQYTDDGKAGAFPPLRGEGTVVLHSRRKKPALADVISGAGMVEQLEGERGIVGHFRDGAAVVFRELNLTGIRNVTVRAGCIEGRGGKFELRAGSESGELLASATLPPGSGGEFADIPIEVGARGLVDLCVVARCGDGKTVLGLNWIEFRP